ncbi:MAG: bifunctional (p)ppGpp synthetase/guanosine-3',5'-bis(diphosphate) 3'-pyrophosphohydrolase [Pseudomonadota bacterium]
MIRINDIIDKAAAYYPNADFDIIDRAYIYCARVHAGQTRLSGEPYLAHPLEVANILAEMKMDAVCVAAGLLHDTIEDTDASIEELTQLFGGETTHLVAGVTKLSKVSFTTSAERQAESIRKMIVAMANDIRVLIIKLSDRLHNMRTLKFHKPERQRDIAQETLDIYAPLANRLGIFWIKKELEDTSFKHLMPQEYELIRTSIANTYEERERHINTIRSLLEEKMQENGLTYHILGRHKHFYSIYQKMLRQNVPFEDVYDILAFRIILNNERECYEALGLIHSTFKPIMKRFKDYIAMPKSNMYQSLHTTVIGPSGERLEIQIRTHAMNSTAEEGIAAHWQYKEGKSSDEQSKQQFEWLRKLVRNQEYVNDPQEYLNAVKIDLFPDEVYVFTPRGEIKEFPKGSTPVDFAYSIHSEVGHKCTGAKIDGKMVPLRYKLQTGEQVEIVTSPHHQPSRDWLSFAITPKAQSRIKQWLRAKDYEKSTALGRELIEKELHRHSIPFNPKGEEIQNTAGGLGFKTTDDLFAAVGYGKTTPIQILHKLRPEYAPQKASEGILEKLKKHIHKKKERTGILVRGLDDIMIRFGKCCSPIPGDLVVGYITQGKGVTVHRAGCSGILHLTPERKIELEWAQDINQTHMATIEVICHNKIGLLADLSSTISKAKANIVDVHIKAEPSDKQASCIFVVEVTTAVQLDSLISHLKKIKHVINAERRL